MFFKITLCPLFNNPQTIIRTSLVAQTVKRLPTLRETWVQALGREDPLQKEMATHSSTLAWKIPRTEELGRLTVHGVAKSRTRLTHSLQTIIIQKTLPLVSSSLPQALVQATINLSLDCYSESLSLPSTPNPAAQMSFLKI